MKIGIGEYYLEIMKEDVESFLDIFHEGIIRLRVPKNKKGKIGIIIAIETENKKEKVRLQKDLIDSMQIYLKNSHIPDIFNIILLPDSHIKKIKSHEDALKYLKRVGGHFMVFGNIYERKLEGENQFVFRLEGVVRHRPIPRLVSNEFAREFTELFPRKWNFPESEELLGFDITQRWLGFVTKYIIGIAAYVSADFSLSFKIFKQLKNETENNQGCTSIDAITEIKKRLPMRLVDSCNLACNILYFSFTKTRDIAFIKKQKEYLDTLKDIKPHDYNASLLRAIYFFLIDNNIPKAKKEIRDSKNRFDSTWRYSLAFLYAYEGNLGEAKKHYDNAFEKYVSPNVINDTEVFMTDILEKEPNKHQLYFTRGYINFKAKGDMLLAKADFKNFLELDSSENYSEEKRLAKIYVKQIG